MFKKVMALLHMQCMQSFTAVSEHTQKTILGIWASTVFTVRGEHVLAGFGCRAGATARGLGTAAVHVLPTTIAPLPGINNYPCGSKIHSP